MPESPDQLKRMIVSAMNAQETESARVSKLLHDQVGQVLSAVGLHMDVLKLDFKAAVPEIVERVNEIQKILDTAVQQVRSLSYDLNPSIVERAGFQAALDRLAGKYRAQFGGTLRFSFDPVVRPSLEIGNICYKIADLALDNAVRHANAKKIEVAVKATARMYVMEITDDGCGFDHGESSEHTPGLGLLLIDHYAAQSPVRVDLQSKVGQGTVLKALWTAEKAVIRGKSRSDD